MELKILMKTARSVSFEIMDGGIYNTQETYDILVNGKLVRKTDTVITSLFGLKPQTVYHLEAADQKGRILGSVDVTTEEEFVTLDVRDFGAKGDGIQDDTSFIQAAILCCPKNGRVLVKRGTYRITSLFLKSDLKLEIAGDAVLKAIPDKEKYPKLPGRIESWDETEEYYLGTWEGNPQTVFSGVLSGIHLKNVVIYGEGTIDGNASWENWWSEPKTKEGVFRPRLLFLNHCEHVKVQGLVFTNSPSWTLHPYFSDHLSFINVEIRNPSNSPNTDGLDPESCRDVEVLGVKFSLGDDCIAVKSGKIYMGRKYKRPTENMRVRQCLMEKGHGAVTLGSEIAGGVKNLLVENCRFSHTDRGLRIKTRRGRGEDSVVDEICFRNLEMDHVLTPFVVNCFYYCDPDGKTTYVQQREKLPVDERTPVIKKLVFENIKAKNCHIAAAYLEGLPERKIEEIRMKNVDISYAEDAKTGIPAMTNGVCPQRRQGLFARNVEKLVLENVKITGQEGEAFRIWK
jgi:polygalacturonase